MNTSKILTSVACCSALLTLPALAQPDLSGVEIEAQSVAGSIYMLTGSGGNMGLLVGDDATFLVDDQYAPLTGKIVEAISAISERPVDFVLNTHWHGDHTGGNENLGNAGVWIVAHENVRKRMSSDQFLAAFNAEIPASPEVALPAVTYADSITFHLNGEEIYAKRFVESGHTDGDSVVFFKTSNVVHMGDTLFAGMYPFIDTSTGGSLSGMIANSKAVLELIGDDTKVIPGHGPLSTKADLQATHDMLTGIHEAMVALVGTGVSKEEAVAAKPTAPWDAQWGGGFMTPDVFTGIIYDSVRAALPR